MTTQPNKNKELISKLLLPESVRRTSSELAELCTKEFHVDYYIPLKEVY